MRLIMRIIVIGVLTYFISPISVWWVAILIPMIICAIFHSSWLNAFIAGFLGVGITWLAYAWDLDVQNLAAFSSTISKIMQLEDPFYLVLGTGVIGGTAGGIAALSGTTFRQIFLTSPKRKLYI